MYSMVEQDNVISCMRLKKNKRQLHSKAQRTRGQTVDMEPGWAGTCS